MFTRQNVQKRLTLFFSDSARSDIHTNMLALSISLNLFHKHLYLFHICALFVRLAAAHAVCLQLSGYAQVVLHNSSREVWLVCID